MRVLKSQKEIASTFDGLLDECRSVSFAVAWASCGFHSCDRLLKHRKKISKAVVGTHFYQTDPEFIEAFIGSKNVKFITSTSGVFHPKFYLFEGPRNSWNCMVGSANFTSGGFGQNKEVVIHVDMHDDPTCSISKELRKLVDSYINDPMAKWGDEIDLDQYRLLRKRFNRTLDKAKGKYGSLTSSKTLADIELLALSWPEYLLQVRGDQHNALSDRIKVLGAARRLFQSRGSLSEMEQTQRGGIAGFIEKSDIPWGWFGSMKGAGVFKRLVIREPKGLSGALDCIPLDGIVDRADYMRFINSYRTSFPKKGGEPSGHGLATATRILAMKRPDYFVCFDSQNRSGICNAFGISMKNHDYENYWDAIIERILDSKWWNSSRPHGRIAGQVWDGRAAFLDAIYYEPVG